MADVFLFSYFRYLYVAAKHGVPIAGADRERATTLVQEAHRQCVIANSLHANVHIDPTFAIAETP